MSQAAARRVPQARRSVNLTLDRAAVSFERHLRAENKSPATITTYLVAVNQFRDFAQRDGLSDELRRVTRDHIEAFLVASRMAVPSRRPALSASVPA